MQIGLIGLGKMGFNLALNMFNHGHEVIGHEINEELLKKASEQGIKTASTIENLVGQLQAPRIIWLMIPAGDAIDSAIQILKEYVTPGDIIIDGGNSFYKDSMRRAHELDILKIEYLDCGTSGGTEGARNGICAMIARKTYLIPVNHCSKICPYPKDTCIADQTVRDTS